jgi:hypothetical protein
MIDAGATNDNEIVVRKGLSKDDRVLLTAPADKATIKTEIIPGLQPTTPDTTGTDKAKGITLPAKPDPKAAGKAAPKAADKPAPTPVPAGAAAKSKG